MEEELKIQNFPIVDGLPSDPFETLVEVCYQIKGYITSSNKWFWVWESRKKQRGYRDIDVLAVNDKETLIVSVTINLNDKINLKRSGELDEKKNEKLLMDFRHMEDYLKKVGEYKWLVENREVKRILAYAHGYIGKRKERLKNELEKEGIELIGPQEDIIKEIENWVGERGDPKRPGFLGFKTNNPIMRVIELKWRIKEKEEYKRKKRDREEQFSSF